jgi:hypothetical protein
VPKLNKLFSDHPKFEHILPTLKIELRNALVIGALIVGMGL